MYEYKGCGFGGVFLKDGFTVVDTPYGRGVTIDDVEGLHKAISMEILSQDHDMTGQQFRFLRKQLELTQEDVAQVFRVDAQTIANWEKKQGDAIPRASDLAMRLIYSTLSGSQVEWSPSDRLDQIEDSLVFAHEKNEWIEMHAECA